MLYRKFTKHIPVLAVSISTLLFSLSVSAATFCVVNSSGKMCTYFDYSQCSRDADQMNGDCVANVPAGSGSAPFCAVSSVAMCVYYDKSQCKQAAANNNGVCVANPNSK